MHDALEAATEPVQNVEKTVKKRHFGRSQEAKVGRIKYTFQLIKEMRRDIEEIKLSQRTILAGLKGLFNFEKPMIQKVVCQDEVDELILELLSESGGVGLLPKELAAKLTAYKVKRHQVTRRLQRVNRRVEKELGERLVEKRGWHWAFTGFANEVWGLRTKDMAAWSSGELNKDNQEEE